MDVWMIILCVLGSVLLVITILGHLMWLLLAAIFRALFGDGAAEFAPAPPRAPPTPKGAEASARDGRRQVLIELQQQVRLWQHQGILTSQQVQTLQAWITRELQQRGVREEAPGVGRAAEAAGPGLVPRPTVAEGMQAADRTAAPGATVSPTLEEHPVLARAADAVSAEAPLDAELVAIEPPTTLVPQAAEPAQPRQRGEEPTAPIPTPALHPLDRRDEPVAAPQPAQRPLSDILHSFMEERNIRWAELMAAGLIVLSSVGLVVSLRATLRKVPYFPALLFTLFTVAFHSAGLYTLRQWRLETVSRVILLIGLMLVPLTFCAGVLLSPQAVPTGGLLAVLAVATGVLAWVAWSASRVLVPDLAWPLAAGVVLCGLALVPIQSANQPGPATLTLLAMPPLAGLGLVGGALLVRMAHWRQWSRPRLVRAMRALGVSLFAFLVPLALLLAKVEQRRETLATLSPWLSLVAVGLLAVGLRIQQRTTARALAEWQTAGTAIAIVGAAALLGLTSVAWPAPGLLLLVSTAAGLALVVLGAVSDLVLLWPPGVVCLALASTLAWHLVGGQLHWTEEAAWQVRSQRLIQTLLMARSGLWLGLVAGGLLHGARRMSGTSMLQARFALPPPDEATSEPAPLGRGAGLAWQLVDALHSPRAALQLAAGVLALLGLAIALYAGFVPAASWPQDRLLAGPLLAAYGAGSLVAGFAARQALWVRVGSATLWVALVQMLGFQSLLTGWHEALGWKGPLRHVALLMASLLHGCGAAAAALALDILGARRAIGGRGEANEGYGACGDAGAGMTTGGRQHGLSWEQAIAAWPFKAWPGGVLAETAVATLGVALPVALVWAVVDGQYLTAAWAVAALAAGWLVVMLSVRWPVAWQVAAAMAGLAVVLGVAGWAEASAASAASAAASPSAWGLPWAWVWSRNHLWGQTLGTAAVGAGLMLAARGLQRWPRGAAVAAQPPWGGVPVLCVVVATVFLVVGGWAPSVVAIARELGVSRTEAVGDAAPLSAVDRLGWMALAAVVAAWGVGLVDPRHWEGAVIGWSLASFAAVGLAALHGGQVWGAASLARWGAALHLGIWSALFLARRRLSRWHRRWRPRPSWTLSAQGRRWLAVQPLASSGGVILVLTLLTVAQHLSGVTLWLPASGLTQRLGPTIDLLGPWAALAVVLAAYAWHLRHEAYALAAWCVVQTGANLALVCSAAWQQAGDDVLLRAVLMLQANAVAAAFSAALWAAGRRWRQPSAAKEAPPTADRPAIALTLRAAQVRGEALPLAVAMLSIAGLGAIVAWTVFWEPVNQPRAVQQAGHGLSGTAVALTALAVLAGSGGWPVGMRGMWPVLAALVPVVAAALARLDSGGQWVAYHGLEAGWGLVGLAGLAVCAWRREATAPASWIGLLVLLLTLLALRGNEGDPQEPWWSLGALALSGTIAAVAALVRRSIPWSWASWCNAGLAALALCLSPSGRMWVDAVAPHNTGPLVAGELVFLTLVLAAGGWLGLEIWSQRQGVAVAPAGPWPRTHEVAIGLLAGGCLLWRWLYAQLVSGNPPAPWGYHAWAACGTLALGVLVAATLWEERAWYALAAAYWWGLAGWGVLVAFSRDVVVQAWLVGPMRAAASTSPLSLYPEWSHVHSAQAGQCAAALSCTALALHTAICGQLWFHGASWAAWAARLGISQPLEGLKRTDRWLPLFQVLLTGLLTLGATELVLMAELRAVQVAAAILPAVAAWGLACLAQGRRQARMQLVALLLAGYAAVLLGWVETVGSAPALAVAMLRTFRLLMVLCGLTFVYAWVLPRWLLRDQSWQAASRFAASTAAALAVGALVVTFGLEVALFVPGEGTPADSPQVIAVAVLMMLGAAGLVALALVPGHGPWAFAEQGRQAYVYAAEAVLVLVVAHVYLCRPQWFAMGLRPYWPLVVLAIAFAGAGASEIAQRWRLAVLAEPLKRSSQWLPLLPVLGWWVVGSRVDYALLLLAVGLVYLVWSWRFRSLASGLAAVVAGNAALWRWYSDQQLTLLTNPQLWLIPPAASTLVAAQWHRQRLKPQVLTAIRYAATLVIYVSSTSEILIGGFAQGLWQPMLLLGLAVAGALAGIALRVRAFLVLGSAFTMVALLAMVRHAQREIGHVWPWWVFGISLGVMLLVLMGLFEKKRAALQRLARELSQWDG